MNLENQLKSLYKKAIDLRSQGMLAESEQVELQAAAILQQQQKLQLDQQKEDERFRAEVEAEKRKNPDSFLENQSKVWEKYDVKQSETTHGKTH